MQLRRVRTHNHGFSNRSLGCSLSNQSCLFANNSQFKNKSQLIHRQSELKAPAQLTFKNKNMNKNILKKTNIPPFEAEKKLKSMHAAKKSIKKIVKGWNLHELQTIDTNEFHKIVNDKLKLSLTYQQAQDIVNKYSKNGKLDTKKLVQILFQQHDHISFNPTLSTSVQKKQQRSKSVNNLLEDLSAFKPKQHIFQPSTNIQINNLLTNYNRFVAKVRKICPNSKQINLQEIQKCSEISKVEKQSFEKVKSILNQQSCIEAAYNLQDISQKVYYELVNKRYRAGNKQLPVDTYQKQFIPSNNSFYLRSSLTNSKNYLNAAQRSLDLDPKQFTNIDQQKTRFGANPNLLTIDNTLDKQNICCEKQKIDKLLRQQRDKAKVRYENKLQKIRQNRCNQLQRINQTEEKYLKTQQANLLKRGTEQAAYNYVSFIQNQWK